MVDEIWKPINGLSSLYEVSNKCRIRSWKPPNGVGNKAKTPRILKTHINRTGYRYASFRHNGKVKKITIGRLVAVAFVPNPNNYPEVNHIDGNKLNDFPDNLEWLNRANHLNHTLTNNLNCKGSEIGTSVLHENDVLLIKTLPVLGFTQREIADAWNVHFSTISKIFTQKSWYHL